MADFTIDECQSCHAKVIWAVTTRARTMPVDAEPVADGNVQLEHRGEGVTPLAHVLSIAQRFGKKELRRSHFASCPDAAKWRHRAVRRRG